MVPDQRVESKNKLYSLHSPDVKCVSKGKERKKYEFGNKNSFVITKNSGIVFGALAFEKNLYDGHAIEPQLEQLKDLFGRLPDTALV